MSFYTAVKSVGFHCVQDNVKKRTRGYSYSSTYVLPGTRYLVPGMY